MSCVFIYPGSVGYNEETAVHAESERLVMIIDTIIVGQLEVNCYIVSDESTSEAVIIDPGDEYERIAGLTDARGSRPKYILFTHAHYDHVCAVRELKDRYHALTVMHQNETGTYEMTKKLCISWGYEEEDFPAPDMLVREGDRISIGKTTLEVIHTPGHTPGCICLYGENCLFTGDTLFKGSVGRTDLPGGNTEKLLASLKKIVLLPPETKVFCGHGEETTLDREVRRNPFLNNTFRPNIYP